MMSEKKIHVGGQAVIEGVMMRSPDFVSVAVRRPDGKIVCKRDPYVSLSKRIKFLGWPFLRGAVTLIESMVLGIKALNFSGEIAMTEEEREKAKSKEKGELAGKLMMGGTVVLALGLGIGLFFFLPLVLTELTGVTGGVMFNLIDGAFRLTFFLAYLFLISLWKEIRRVFEYHGAEHKSIFAFEDGKALNLDNIRPYVTHHPRCGTSFLLIVMLVSLLVFMGLGRPDSVTDRLIRFLFIPVIGDISYEIIRLSDSKIGRQLSGLLVAPGLWLQRITTKEPDDSQLEVAVTALKSALNHDLSPDVEIFAVE